MILTFALVKLTFFKTISTFFVNIWIILHVLFIFVSVTIYTFVSHMANNRRSFGLTVNLVPIFSPLLNKLQHTYFAHVNCCCCQLFVNSLSQKHFPFLLIILQTQNSGAVVLNFLLILNLMLSIKSTVGPYNYCKHHNPISHLTSQLIWQQSNMNANSEKELLH